MEERGWTFSCKNCGAIYIWWVHLGSGAYTLFSFVMMYGLSSNNVLYSTSNQFLYLNKILLHFLNIKQEFSFKNWFLCLCYHALGQHWEKWNKKMSKTSGCPGYISDFLWKCGLKLLPTILWTIVLWTRFDMYNSSYVFCVGLPASARRVRWNRIGPSLHLSVYP